MKQKQPLVRIKISPEQRRDIENRNIKDIMEEHLAEVEVLQMQKMLKDDDYEMLQEDCKKINYENNILEKELVEVQSTMMSMEEEIKLAKVDNKLLAKTIEKLNNKNKELVEQVSRLNKYNRFEVMEVKKDK